MELYSPIPHRGSQMIFWGVNRFLFRGESSDLCLTGSPLLSVIGWKSDLKRIVPKGNETIRFLFCLPLDVTKKKARPNAEPVAEFKP